MTIFVTPCVDGTGISGPISQIPTVWSTHHQSMSRVTWDKWPISKYFCSIINYFWTHRLSHKQSVQYHQYCSVCQLVGLQQSVYLAEFLLNLPAFIFKSNNKTLQNDYYHHHLPTSDLQQMVEKQSNQQVFNAQKLQSKHARVLHFENSMTDRQTNTNSRVAL